MSLLNHAGLKKKKKRKVSIEGCEGKKYLERNPAGTLFFLKEISNA